MVTPLLIPRLSDAANASTLDRRSAGRIFYYDPSLPPSLTEALWRGPETLLAAGKIMRQTGKSRSTVLVEWGSIRYVLKHYGSRSLRHTVKHSLVGSQARHAYELGCTLADAGVPTPRPVACIDNSGRVLGRDSYLIYPYVEGCSLADAIGSRAIDDRQIEHAERQLEALWQQLIELRVGLRDANTGNVILTPEGRLWLIDLDDCRFHHSGLIARHRLHRRWDQLCRGIGRAKWKRDVIGGSC